MELMGKIAASRAHAPAKTDFAITWLANVNVTQVKPAPPAIRNARMAAGAWIAPKNARTARTMGNVTKLVGRVPANQDLLDPDANTRVQLGNSDRNVYKTVNARPGT